MPTINGFYADECRPYKGDGKLTLFAQFPNAWHSYEAHSELLTSKKRYQVATRCDNNDYACWANGLQQA